MRKAVIVTSLSAMLLTGCATDGSGPDKQSIGTVLGAVAGGLIGSQIGGGSGRTAAIIGGVLVGGLIGNQIGASLDRADKAAIEQESARTLSQAKDGQSIQWNNPQSGAQATITPSATHEETRTVAVLRDKSVAPVPAMVLIGETYEAAKSANVRSAPNQSSNVVSSLKAGETFNAVGRVDGSDWIVVGKGNRTVGYVHTSLVHKASIQTAAAPTMRKAVNLDELEAQNKKDSAVNLDAANSVAQNTVVTAPCRNLDLKVSAKNGTPEQQNMKACKSADGAWEIL